MKTEELSNLPVLGTALQLVSEIALEVVGSDLEVEIDGRKTTPESVRLLAAAALNQSLSEK